MRIILTGYSFAVFDFVCCWYDMASRPKTHTHPSSSITHTHAHTHMHKHKHTHTPPFNGPLSRTTRVSRCQNGKPIWILLKQETVSGSGISWAICKSAPRSRQITTLALHHSVFTGWMPFLTPNQQRQEGHPACKKPTQYTTAYTQADSPGAARGLGVESVIYTYIDHNRTSFTLTFRSQSVTFVGRSCSVLLPVLATVVM